MIWFYFFQEDLLRKGDFKIIHVKALKIKNTTYPLPDYVSPFLGYPRHLWYNPKYSTT